MVNTGFPELGVYNLTISVNGGRSWVGPVSSCEKLTVTETVFLRSSLQGTLSLPLS